MTMKPLVLGLGNELLGDDAIGILAARRVAETYARDADVVESGLHGLALIDVLAGHDRAIIIDAIQTGRHPPGTVIELSLDDLKPTPNPSPHYTGLPEMTAIARGLDVTFPDEVRILAVEISDAATVGGTPNSAVMAAIDELVGRAGQWLHRWKSENLPGRNPGSGLP